MRESQCSTSMSCQFGRTIIYGENSAQRMQLSKVDNGLYRSWTAGQVQTKRDMPVIGQCLGPTNPDNDLTLQLFGRLSECASTVRRRRRQQQYSPKFNTT